MHNVFVYGTLKKGFRNYHHLNDENNGMAKFICNGKTKDKYPMVIATPFFIPFLLNAKGQGHNIPGEVYEVNDKMLEFLDKFENHPKLYTRTSIEITTENKTLNCGVYILYDFKPNLLDLDILECYSGSKDYVPPADRPSKDVLFAVKNN